VSGFSPEAGGILSQRLPGAVVGQVSAGREVGWSVVGSDATFLVAKESMKRRGVVTLRAAGRCHAELGLRSDPWPNNRADEENQLQRVSFPARYHSPSNIL
jgi:hypothetical protein